MINASQEAANLAVEYNVESEDLSNLMGNASVGKTPVGAGAGAGSAFSADAGVDDSCTQAGSVAAGEWQTMPLPGACEVNDDVKRCPGDS